MVDLDFLAALADAPSVGTACGPVLALLGARFGDDWTAEHTPDGFTLFHRAGYSPSALRAVMVAHVDEVGGCVYGPRADGGFVTRFWGNDPSVFANARLQAFDYLAASESRAFPVTGQVVHEADDTRLVLHGEGIRPYRTVYTFKESARFDGDTIEGKALDPRVTAYAVAEAVLALNSPEVGALFVMAEECAMDVARKAVTFLARHAPDLELIVNADVPEVQNLGEGRLDMPAIRIFEGRNFIDPSFGIRCSDSLADAGVEHHLSAARSGSQTLLFTPLAPTLSIALPSHGIHKPRYQMSLVGVERCIRLLTAIGERGHSPRYATRLAHLRHDQ